MFRKLLVVASFVLVAATAQAQALPPRPPRAPQPPAPVVVPGVHEVYEIGPELADLRATLDLELSPMVLELEPVLAGVNAQVIDLANTLDTDVWQAAAATQVFRARGGDSESIEYSRGTSHLDKGRYEEALQAFNKVIAANGKRADGAMYWKAYSLNRLGRGSEGLATLDELLKKFPSSRWANDARALQVEIRQASGRPVNPAQESDEELKLIALNGLMSRDPERGLPMVEQILSGASSPRLKERALFVLAHSGSPRAKTLLTDIARGKGNPDLQMKALDYLGILGGGPDVPLLVDIYKSNPDVEVKRRVIRSLAMAAGRRGVAFGVMAIPPVPPVPPVPVVAPVPEPRPSAGMSKEEIERLRAEAQEAADKARADIERHREEYAAVAREYREYNRVRSTGSAERDKARETKAKEAADALWQLYQAEGSNDLKREILRNMYFGDQSDRVLQIARTEKDTELRQSAVQALMFSRTPKTADTLVALYRDEKDPSVKRRIIDVLGTMNTAGPLVQIARQETDPQLRKTIVQRLSLMKDKEATDYLMELLKK